jgi:hypothetical protein
MTVSILIFQEKVLSNVTPRHLVLWILTIFLFPWIIFRSSRKLVLVTNCINWVLSTFNDNKLVENHLFMSWKTLLTVFSNFIWLELLTIILLSSAIFYIMGAAGSYALLVITYEAICFQNPENDNVNKHRYKKYIPWFRMHFCKLKLS